MTYDLSPRNGVREVCRSEVVSTQAEEVAACLGGRGVRTPQ